MERAGVSRLLISRAGRHFGLSICCCAMKNAPRYKVDREASCKCCRLHWGRASTHEPKGYEPQRARASAGRSDDASLLRPLSSAPQSPPRRSKPEVYVVASLDLSKFEKPTDWIAIDGWWWEVRGAWWVMGVVAVLVAVIMVVVGGGGGNGAIVC